MPISSEDEILPGVAVVGLAGRFPGAGSVEALWENLREGRESIRVFSDEELAAAGVSEDLIRDPSFVKARGLIDDPEMFDAGFFGIAPREAELMDPQHRLFLETCWHALENAGYPPASVRGTVGVWGGMSTGMSNDTYLHSNLGGPRGVPEEDVLPAMLGNENDYLTTRVSYKLDLRGPSVNVQSACSTSLVAIVQAFQSLMTYGCDMALAGGVSVSYPQENGYLHQEGGIGSPDGHCRPFDADAQGTVFSNGVGVVVLKRLDEAMEDGDSILAVIRGAASNNDGASKMSFAAPSASGQAEVIATALAVADVEPSSVTYVETHGTGTPIGDPIELEGLTRAFRRETDERGFCALGSIKSNFGHLDSAAGVAGFIKAVLCLRHRTLVPTVHFRTPSPRFDWENSPFFVNAETREWTTDRLPRRAGVSAFGIGGTNAHVILEEPPVKPRAPSEAGAQVIPLSARSRDALGEAIRNLAGHLDGEPDLRLADVAHTLQVGRERFRHRAIVVARDVEELRDILTSGDRTRIITGQASDTIDSCVFLFPGGGAQHVGMGRGLYDANPGFRSDVDEGLDLMRSRDGLDLRSVWFASPDSREADEAFQRPSVQLPAIFILEMALARLLIRWGFEPSALIGHSMGENTAACLAGVLSYADALGLVALRGRLFDSAVSGGMLSVTASPATLHPYLGADLDMAAVNGPEQCTVSGPRAAIDRLAADLERAGIDAQVVPIDIAAHSSLVDPLLEPFEAYLRSVELRPPRIPFLSNRSGTWITDEEATDPAYWASHLRGTVRFADNVRTVLAEDRPFFLEVGPGRILSSLVKLSDPGIASRVTATMRHPREVTTDEHALLAAIGRVWVEGGDVAWDRIRGDATVSRVPLPGYPFERRRFLVEPCAEASSAGAAAQRFPAGGAASPASLVGGETILPTGSGISAPNDLVRRVLDLRAQTDVAIQRLLARQAGTALSAEPDASSNAAASLAHSHAAAEQAASASGTPPAVAPPRSGAMNPTGGSLDSDKASEPANGPVRPAAETPDLDQQWAFWTEHLHSPLPVLDLMTDRARSSNRPTARETVDAALALPIEAACQRLAREEDTTPFVVALAAYCAVLHLETGQEEFVVGTPLTPRDTADAAAAAEVMPLRTRVDAGGSFRGLVRTVREVARDARLNGDVPFRELLAKIDPTPDPTRSPVYQTRFDWRVSDGEWAVPAGVDPTLTDFDVRIESSAGAWRVTAEYDPGLFESGTLGDLLGHLVEVLRIGTDQPDTLIRAFPSAGPGVMARLSAWNNTSTPLPEVSGLAEWLTDTWSSAAGEPAVVAGGQRLTYAELDERSNRLAHHLIEAGVVPGSLVGLCLPRSADMIVGAIAVWKAGAGYVPLDPSYPTARLGLMADRAQLDVVIGVESLQDRIEGYEGKWILLDGDRSAISDQPASAPRVRMDLEDPAYVIFTSGSTGEPKGVKVPGRCVVNFLASMSRRPGFAPTDVLLAVTTLSFDISVLEIFLPLRMGGCVVVASDADVMDGSALIRLLDEHAVTVMQATPSTWRLLLSAGWGGRPGLRALCGGEAFPRDLLRQLLPRVSEVWNMYGPTETTVWSTCARLTDGDAPIHIGTPIANTRCHVLDEGGRAVPPGVPGELCIGGDGVTDGYVGRPEETERRFVPEPPPETTGRMYRTGDAVRWRRDGTLEHLHRTDQQVKLRGFRIELGEVEAALAAQEGVNAAAVTVADLDGRRELVGYVVAEAGASSERSLRENLLQRLPGYMVPRIFVRLDALPLTENGKVDRKALPDPRLGSGWAVGEELASPETEAEAYLHGVWQEVLEMSAISVHDNFFDLGGHSLLAVRTIIRIRDERGVELPLRALLSSTLRTIAGEFLPEGGAASEREPEESKGAVGRLLDKWISR